MTLHVVYDVIISPVGIARRRRGIGSALLLIQYHQIKFYLESLTIILKIYFNFLKENINVPKSVPSVVHVRTVLLYSSLYFNFRKKGKKGKGKRKTLT